MATRGRVVLLPGGKRALRPGGKAALFNSSGKCDPCCNGGASNSCADLQNCWDGDALSDPPQQPTMPLISMTYTACAGRSSCPESQTQWGNFVSWRFDWPSQGYDAIDPVGVFYPILQCVAGGWNFQAFSGLTPATGCYGSVNPNLRCSNGMYPTGTFTVPMFDEANGDTPCGYLVVTIS